MEAERYRVQNPLVQVIFPFLKTSRSTLGPTQPPIQGVSGFFPRGKPAEAWRKPLTSIYSRGYEWVEPYLYTPYMPSRSGQRKLYLIIIIIIIIIITGTYRLLSFGVMISLTLQTVVILRQCHLPDCTRHAPQDSNITRE